MESICGEKASENIVPIDSVSKTFNIGEIREIILGYVIQDNRGKLLSKNAKSVRLVSSSWLKTTSRLLKNSCHPAVTLKLDKCNSSSQADEVKGKGKLLDRFTATFSDPARIHTSLLSVKLTLKIGYFLEENFKSLVEFFTRCGNYLIELEVTFPCDGGSMPLSFPTLTLPLLKKITFNLSRKKLNPDLPQVSRGLGNSRTALWFLQNILNGCTNLKILEIPLTSKSLPNGFEFIQLPASIETLKLGCRIKSQPFNILLFNQLPNLSTLEIHLHETVLLDNDMLFKIHERYHKKLKTLHLSGTRKHGRPQLTASLRFPIMENLEQLSIFGPRYQLNHEQLPCLQQCFPKLKCVHLNKMTETKLGQWVDNTKFENVNQLRFSMENEYVNFERHHHNRFKSPSLEIMAKVHVAFPNITVLTIDVNVGDLGCLALLFQNMNQLRWLRFSFRGKFLGNSVDLIDSLFLGLPLSLGMALKQDIEFLEAVVLKNDIQPSIGNLAELTGLILHTKVSPSLHPEDGTRSLISELLIQALLKMVKLKNLCLYGKFKPTAKMEQQWKDDGRSIKYLAEVK